MDKLLILTSLRNVGAAGVYIFGISQFLYYGERLFDNKSYENLMPFLMLLLLSLSAAVVGSLVFGPTVLLFLENKKTESIKSAMYSVLWLFVLTVSVVAGLLIVK